MRKNKEAQKAVLRARLKTYVSERVLRDMSLSQLLTLSNYADKAERQLRPASPKNERALYLLQIHAILNGEGLLTRLLTQADEGDIDATLSVAIHRYSQGNQHYKPLLDILVTAMNVCQPGWKRGNRK